MNKKFCVQLRRLSSSVNVRRIWKAIEVIHNQRQLANYERIRRYMNRMYDMTDNELTEHLENCLHDGLLLLTKTLRNKGSMIGVQQEGYVLPRYCTRDGHDWYCFQCHLSGEVVPCSYCHRVYHLACVKTSTETQSEFSCNICTLRSSGITNLSKDRLNQLLGYVFSHLNESLPPSTTLWQKIASESLIIECLIYKTMNLDIIQSNISNALYSQLEEFKADVRTLFHNVIIFKGEHSSLAELIKKAVDACLHDVKEIELCADCYQTSHEKHDELWFCKPCHPPHELVYAQVKGYPFWPAKVIERINKQFDVRFFGPLHQRALIDQDRIKAITENINELQKSPKSVSWQKACRELLCHQMLLNKTVVGNQKEHQNILPKERQNNGLVRWNQSPPKIRLKRKIHWRKKHRGSFANDMKKSLSKEDNPAPSSSPACPRTSVSVQTFCLYHKQHKCIMDLKNEDFKFSEENYDTEEMVDHAMQMYEQKRKIGKTRVQMTCDDNHSFHNAYCPLNKFRKNIFSSTEVETEMKAAIAEATDIINKKYNEVVDRKAQSHFKMLQEIKGMAWCSVCDKEASIHCCWYVDYCSQKCQSEHWEGGHKQECLLRMLMESS